MLIGKRAYYYIKTLLFFAFSARRSFSIKEISQRVDISAKILEQVLLSLKNEGMLISKRGPRGGYTLAREISALSVADIMEIAGQKIRIMPSSGTRNGQLLDEVLEALEGEINKEVSARLKRVKVKDIVKDMNERIGEDGLNYVI